jgi:hypothetical protein
MAPPKMSKRSFLRSGEGAIASYSYTDIAEGTGIVEFYPYVADSAGSDDYFLTTNSSVGSKVAYWGPADGALINQDFDSAPFNMPKNMKGDLIANIAVGRLLGNNGAITAVITVYHVTAAAVATQLGTATDSTPNNAAAALPEKDCYMCMKIPITLKHFQKGEYVRITINVSSSGGAAQGLVGADPLNRTDITQLPNSRTKFLIPFVLDL